MILQALKAYYDRRISEGENDLATEGFEKKVIPFLIIISREGAFIDLLDTREQRGKKLIGNAFVLPRSFTRTGSKAYEKPFLLWDHIGFVFGSTADPDSNSKAIKQHASWLKMLINLPEQLKQTPDIAAILSFYENKEMQKVKAHRLWPDCLKANSCNVTFQIAGELLPIVCRQEVKDYVVSQLASNEDTDNDKAGKQVVIGRCLITGDKDKISRIHGRTSIDKDTKSLVAFQKSSGYDSYGKEQCYNAPVSRSAEFAYVTGLNTLLKAKSQKIQIANTVIVFWAAKRSDLEQTASLVFSEPPTDDPHHDAQSLQAVYNSIWTGSYQFSNEQTSFYILGLSPNSARISVRLWEEATVQKIGVRLRQHIVDLSMIPDKSGWKAFPLKFLLESISFKGDSKNIPPSICGETIKAILSGTPYPKTLLQAAVRRIRAEQAKRNPNTGRSEPNVTCPRAALVKACVNRAIRFSNPRQEKELTMSLDPSNNNIGYRLGRLFAALEKIQGDAQPGLNSTIRDRFYGAASSTPVTVFGNLMRLKNHHLSKLSDGLRITRERQLQEIMDGIPSAGFPAHLDLADQGRFAVGYYHQMQAFFTKKSDSTETGKE